ncbi:gastrin-releasing peptide [Gasterosteus aculeatus]
MGGVCGCSWSCRPMWRLFILLATVPCLLLSAGSPAAVVGKVYPRGKHWAVGHLMGKKSIESLPVLRQTNAEGHYLRLPGAPGATQRLTEAVMPQRSQKRTMPRAAGWLLRMRSGWREEERDKYLREMSDLLLLALKLRDQEPT